MRAYPKLVVGHVLSCEDVPDTHLHLCQVDTGDAEGPRQIVCGAPNVTAGIKVNCCHSWCPHCG